MRPVGSASSLRPPKVVSDGHNLLLESDYAGDEPFMLASNLSKVAVLVDKDVGSHREGHW